MDIRQLQYFIAVIEEGTISAAARKLNISQPPLSTQIRLLETEVGTQLFMRGARQITLTPAGRRLYQYALEMTDIERQALEEIREMSRGGTGTLRIGCISSSHVPEAYDGLIRFHEQYPLVRFRIAEGNTYELEEQLARNELEIAFVRTPENFKNVRRLVIRHDPMMAAGKTDLFVDIPSRKKLTVRELADYPIILYKRWERKIRNTFEFFKINPQIVYVADDIRTCLLSAEHGLGICISPLHDLHGYPGLTRRIIAEPALESTLELVIREDEYISSNAKIFFDIFEKLYGKDKPEGNQRT
ncbi:MAG: LysR family transcriptional regulator [Acidaminococcus sp.]|jgi:DNA-binding transcriptional LysR family regulator|nr:LysR family transcriptional regulator [Acidaminococcus sp.]MCI2101031.1 LysR family transcriptional regulator [Acidaminococcus sp.]